MPAVPEVIRKIKKERLVYAWRLPFAPLDICMNKTYHELHDFSSTGKERPWQEKKNKSLIVSESFKRLGNLKRASKIHECGTFLEFKQFSDKTLKLHLANFCKARLCPMCAWRRSLKIYGQLSQIIEQVQKMGDYAFLFLTLTVRNCGECELKETIDDMLKGYDRFFKKPAIKKVILGAYRALEVTHNTDEKSKSFDTFHPHFHIILAVKKSYFKSKDYLSSSQISELWQSCIKADYSPIVDIRRITEDKFKGIEHAVAETAKYTVKDDDYIIQEDENLMDKTIFVLDDALRGRRLISFRGIFKEAAEILKLDDAIDGDLVHVGDDPERDNAYKIVKYCWNKDWLNYFLTGGD